MTTLWMWSRAVIVWASLLALPLAAESPAAPTETEEGKTEAPSAPDPRYASPRATLATFREAMRKLESDPGAGEAWESVSGALDLSKARDHKEPAWHLHGVFRGFGGDFREELAPDAEGVAGRDRFELFPGGDAVRRLREALVAELGPPPGAIVLEKSPGGAWRFSAATLDGIYDLFDWIRSRAERHGFDIGRFSAAFGIREFVPEALKGWRYAGLQLWQWIGLLVVIFLAVLADLVARLLLRPLLRRLLVRYVAEPDDGQVRVAARPLGLVTGALVFLGLLPLLLLGGRAATALSVAGELVLIAGAVWAAWAVTDVVAAGLLERAKRTETAFDDMIIPLARKSLKLFIVALGLIYIAGSLDIDVAPLLASFGLAGLAVSFAAQDTVKNLFGGLTIFLDHPFKIGERVIFRGYDGVIEEIGFRTTKLRTLTGHLVTIPNGAFSSEPVENPARRPTIRRILNVTITYDTPVKKIEPAVGAIRSILEEEGIREPIHPVVDGAELAPRVYFNDFNPDSLNIFVIYWYAPPAWWDYNEHAERVNIRIMEEFEKAGIEFAFPTQTVYLADDPKRRLAVRLREDEEGLEARAAASRGARKKKTAGARRERG